MHKDEDKVISNVFKLGKFYETAALQIPNLTQYEDKLNQEALEKQFAFNLTDFALTLSREAVERQ